MEVVLVDTSLANYKSLEAGVADGIGIVEFDGSGDGLAQIAQWASGQHDLDAIHILSHGAQGLVKLGTTQLTEAALASPATQAQLAQLGAALTGDGDLLLYGCGVAAGDSTGLLAGIAKATGADLAASTDLTGAARLGGDWTLESQTGAIDAGALALTQYDGALLVVPFVYASDGDDFSPVTSITKTVSTKTISFSGPEMYIFNNGLPDDGLYPYAADGSSGVRFTVSVEAGYSFDIASFGVQSYVGAISFAITWANGTSSGFTQAGINNTGVITTKSSFDTALNDMRSVTITSIDYATFQNFNITDVRLLGPAATVNSATLSADTGTGASDFVTSIAAQTISGTLSANLGSGERVEVSYDNGSTWSNAGTYTVGSTAWSTTTTLSGSNTFVARVANSDASSTAFTHTYALDTTAPTVTFSNPALSADTGASTSDFITRTTAQTIGATLSGAAAAGDRVLGSLDGGASWTDITSKVSGTTLTWNGVTLTGSGTLMLKLADAAGNESSPLSQAYTLDTTAPATGVASAALSNDSGSSGTDLVTNTAAQTISGTLSANLASGETVYVSLNNGASWTAASGTVGSSAWSLGGVTLAASNTLQVKVGDTAGNDGAVLSQAYIFDTTAPTITFSNLALSADTGASASDFITSTAAQTIGATLSGAPGGGDTVFGSLDGGSTWTDITSQVTGTTLAWTGVTLPASGTLMLKVRDAAGNEGPALSRAYAVDTSAPATPGTPALASASDSGWSNNDGVTSDTTPSLSGSADNGSTVSIFDGVTLLGTAAAGAGGWNFTTGALSEGSHAITAVASDTAGNTSAASGVLNISVDGSAPAIDSVAVPANGTYYTGGALDFTVNFSEAVSVDTSGGTPRIALVVGATTRYADYQSGSGSSALVFRYVVQNGDADANGVTIGALSSNGGLLQDAAGNNATLTLNSVGSTAAVDVDGSVASITGVSATTADGAYGSGQTVTIALGFSSAVTVDTSGGMPTLSLDSGGTATYTGGSGSSTLSFSYTVGAGQNSADLDYSSANALVLNGATITETGGGGQAVSLVLSTPGAAGSLGANKNIVIDTAAPALPTATFSVAENAAIGAAVGTAPGTDQTALTYTLQDDAGGRFAIDADSAAITVANGSLLDVETAPGHQVTVRATDASGNTTDTVFTVNLLDVNDAPVLAVNTGIALNTGASRVITSAMLSVTDQDNPATQRVYTVAELPAAGSLALNGTPLSVAATFTQADIDAGKLSYASAATAGSTSFAFTVSDGFGGAIAQTSFSLAVNVPPVTPPTTPPTPPASTTIDGVGVSKATTTNADGSVSQTILIPVITANRVEAVGNNSVADIPLVSSGGTSVLSVQVPVGYGLVVSGAAAPKPAGNALTDLIREIQAHTVAGSSDQLALAGGGTGFLADLPATTPLLVQTIVPSAATGAAASGAPLVIIGNEAAVGTPMTALVIDARALPAGSALQLQNVEFAAIIGAVKVTGGAGSQHVWGDSSAQTIVLGAGDDVLHGGAGDDVIGSAGGNDVLDGGADDDIVFGGIGNDSLLGGSGDDLLQGGRSDIGQWDFYLTSAGQVVGRHNTVLVNAGAHETLTAGEMNTALAELGFVSADQSTLKSLSLLYHAAFHRAPDLAGLNYWAGTAAPTDQFVQSFMRTSEWVNGMGKLSNQDLVQQLYQNTLGHAAPASQLGEWVNKLDSNAISRADILRELALSSEHHAARSSTLGVALGSDNLMVDRGWIADSGDDVLHGGAGNDTLVGGDGIDTAVFGAKLAEYKFLLSPNGEIKLAEARAGGDVDVIQQIEKGQFSDVGIDLGFTQSSQAALQQVGMLYQTVLGRSGDLAGFVFWLDQSLNKVDLAAVFVNSNEFAARYGALDDAAFVSLMYQNASDHGPDAANLQNWTAYLTTHTRAELAAALTANAEIIGVQYGSEGLWIV
nr:DUF4347 domain-containing protein [Massilia polaris]